MSGLTLGLMSLSLVELEILQRSGDSTEKIQAGPKGICPNGHAKVQTFHSPFIEALNVGRNEFLVTWESYTNYDFGYQLVTYTNEAGAILPVLQRPHQVLMNLFLCNACAVEHSESRTILRDELQALPLYLDELFNQFFAIALSITFILAFSEVISQAICTRYGIAVGANFIWLVRILMIICYPIAYPIGKVLDWVLGHNEALFRHARLKALVSIHSNREAMGKVLAQGHSRVPVYSGNPKNIIGLLLVKSLLTVQAETETPVSAVSIWGVPRVPADMPLYDILNEFQKGSSHMVAVLVTTLLLKHGVQPEGIIVDIDKVSKTVAMNVQVAYQYNNTARNGLSLVSEDVEDGEVVGIITLEDVFEELLQLLNGAIYDTASSITRVPSLRRLARHKGAASELCVPVCITCLRCLTGLVIYLCAVFFGCCVGHLKPQGAQKKQGQTARKPSEDWGGFKFNNIIGESY
ncbi:hypothetical protein Ancab_030444 [Ancistrocladus abbreviatus]